MRKAARGASWSSIAFFAVAAVAAPHAFAQGRSPALEAYLTLSNDYRHRGLSLLDSGLSLQVGVDYEHASGFFAGGFATNVDYAADRTFDSQRDHLIHVYSGYAWRTRAWRMNMAVTRYVYPGAAFDYDYSSLSFGATLNRFTYTAGYIDHVYSRSHSAWHHMAGVAQPLPGNFELTIDLGEFDSDAVRGGSYTFWDVGVSKILRTVGLDLRYHAATLAQASPLGDPGGERWVLSLSIDLPNGGGRSSR